jgi:hypothetical protein
MSIHKAHSWEMIHCIGKLARQIHVPFAIQSDPENPLLVPFSYKLMRLLANERIFEMLWGLYLDSEFWILNSIF